MLTPGRASAGASIIGRLRRPLIFRSTSGPRVPMGSRDMIPISSRGPLNDHFFTVEHDMPRLTSCRIMTAAVLALLAAAGPAAAQGEGDLRRENQRLKALASDLQQELDAARARIVELERQIEGLKLKIGQALAAPSTGTPPPEQVTINESVPTASPRALFRAMKQSYQAATKGLEIGDPRTLDGQRQRIVYERAVKSWLGRVHRELRAPVEWHVRIVEIADAGDQSVLRAQAVDPKTRAELGDPFPIVLDKSTRHKLDQLMERSDPDVLIVKGVLLPQPTMNPQRLEPGTFDKPPFIGPFAEFGFLIDAASVVPAREEPQPAQQPGS
jgi:hypothetical protein